MPTVTLLERQKRNPERVNVYLDGEFAFGLNEMDAVLLHKGQLLDEQAVARLQQNDTVHQAVEQGINLLSFRPRSTHEIRTALAKKHDPQIIEAALIRLAALGYLDDTAFCRFWIDNRSTFKPLSTRALRFELRKKGVSDDIIRMFLDDVSDEDAALQAAQSQLRKLRGKPPEVFRTQLMGFLQRRGFGYSVAQASIRQVLDLLQEDDPDYFAE